LIAQLVDWALNLTPDQLPSIPWELEKGKKVIGNEKFLASLQRDLREGPSSPRARTGAIESDLINMWNKMQ